MRSDFKRNKKILVISGLGLWNYGPRWEIYSRFAEKNYEIHYISPFKENIKKPRIFVYKVNSPFFRVISASKNRVYNFLTSSIFWFIYMCKASKKALEIAKKIKPDIVYSHEIFGVLPAYIIRVIYRIPYIVSLQGTVLYPHLGRMSQFIHFYHILAFKLPMDSLIMMDDGTRGDVVAKYYGVNNNKIKFWMNGIDKSVPDEQILSLRKELEIPDNYKIIISVCRLERWKGVHRLIHAVPNIIRIIDVMFIIIGDGSEYKKLIQLSIKLDVTKYVKFLGHITHDNVFDYLSMSDIYVTMQDLSCLSQSLLEAMISGKCIVSLNSGNIKRLLKNGKNAILINQSNIDDLSNVLLNLLDDDQYRMLLGNNAKDYAEKELETWDIRVKKEVELVNELMNVKKWSNNT